MKTGFPEDANNLTVGLRYDLRPNVVLKAEYALREPRRTGELLAAGTVFTY